jgi:hypothetical protein
MAQKLDDSEIVSFKELLMANSIQVDAAVQLLIEKGFFSKEEFFDVRPPFSTRFRLDRLNHLFLSPAIFLRFHPSSRPILQCVF